MVERVAVNHYVGGSSPSFPAKIILSRFAVDTEDACLSVSQGSRFGGEIRWSYKLKIVEHS